MAEDVQEPDLLEFIPMLDIIMSGFKRKWLRNAERNIATNREKILYSPVFEFVNKQTWILAGKCFKVEYVLACYTLTGIYSCGRKIQNEHFGAILIK